MGFWSWMKVAIGFRHNLLLSCFFLIGRMMDNWSWVVNLFLLFVLDLGAMEWLWSAILGYDNPKKLLGFIFWFFFVMPSWIRDFLFFLALGVFEGILEWENFGLFQCWIGLWNRADMGVLFEGKTWSKFRAICGAIQGWKWGVWLGKLV